MRAGDIAREEELARPAHLASVAKITVSAVYLTALFTLNGRYPQLFAGIAFVPICALTVVRHLRALTLGAFVLATPRDLFVRWWDTVFLVPWAFLREERIPWSDLGGLTVKTLRVNGIDTSALEISHAGGTITIEPGVFFESAGELQRRILEYDARRRKPQSPPVDGAHYRDGGRP